MQHILASAVFVFASLCSGCASSLRVGAPISENRELAGFRVVAAHANAQDEVLMVTAQQFIAAGREREGHAFFAELRRRQPQRALLAALEGTMQARIASTVPLHRRIAWVRDAIADLDAGAAGAPLLGRYLRGLVLAELPPLFHAQRQAIDDLEVSLALRDRFPFDIDRGVQRALATAHASLGDRAAAEAARHRGGDEPPGSPALLGNVSVAAGPGFRFSEPRLVREAEGIYVAEGFDMSNIAFVVADDRMLVIDAGSTEAGARAALLAMRAVVDVPIATVVLTHSHWDHVGGLAALLEPGTEVIASAAFPRELARVRAFHPPFRWFFGDGARSLDVTASTTISTRRQLRIGKHELELVPGPSGETEDALFVHVPAHGLLFVGDAFMPYVGSPFAGEGSPEGYLDAIEFVRTFAPRRLVHGHPPLTRYFTIEAMPGLELALQAARAHAIASADRGRSLAALLDDNYVPDGLRDAPAAAQPYLVVRDHFFAQVHRARAGRWASSGEGVDVFTRAEWARALDVSSGRRPRRLARVVERLLEVGDAGMALQLAELGLHEHPEHAGLRRAHGRAIDAQRLRYELVNPFHFIVDSERGARALAPVVVDAPNEPRAPAGTRHSQGEGSPAS